MYRTVARHALVLVVLAVVAVAGFLVRHKRLSTAYQHELNTQWNLLSGAYDSDTYGRLSLNNVWGNVMQSEFFPGNENPRPIVEMRRLTEAVRAAVEATDRSTAAAVTQRLYETLATVTSDPEFVQRRRQGDLAWLEGEPTAR